MVFLILAMLLAQEPEPYYIDNECYDPCEEEIYIKEELEQIQQEETEQNFNFW